MQDGVAIKVDNVSKLFKLPHEKVTSVKSAFINFYRRKHTYEMQQALKDISFEVKKGEFFGIVGRNGSGKSTLLKLLAGIYVPDNGNIAVNGKLTPFIELGVGFDMELTGRDNVYLNGALLGFSRREMHSMYKDIVEFAELEKFMDQKLKNYSSGMQVRLAFSVAVRAKSDILLVDEVLAVGDAAFQRKCFDYFKQLKKAGKTVVFVSHDMNSVREFCDRGILIENSELKLRSSAYEISKEYSKLFMEEDSSSEPAEKQTARRLGNGSVRIQTVKASIIGDQIVVDVKAKVNKPVDGIIYSLHIIGPDGTELTAMNNRMIQVPDIKNPKPGTEIVFKWTMLNVFNDGKYYVMLTMVDSSYRQLDFFEEAASFRVKRLQRSNTAILPPVTVSHRIIK